MRRLVWPVAVWLLLAWPGHANTIGEMAFEVYPLAQADTLSTFEAVKALVGEDGNVLLDARNNRLLVNTTPAHHTLLADLFTKLTLPPRNVRIEVSFSRRGHSRDTGAALHGGVQVDIGPDRTSGAVVLNPELRNQTTTTSSDVKQILLVSSGHEARLEVGEQVPYVDWLLEYGRRWGYLEGTVQWRNVGAHLVVQATVLGDGSTVRIRLTPELSGYADDDRVRTQFARAATEVTVASGQTVSIGGLNKDENFYSRFLIGFDRSGSRQTLDISLTPFVTEVGSTRP
jgi:hypothetical protein